ncbi:redoxin family protein [Chitinophaga sp. Cy-1792]|uniref:redoxin family protein n=1 Tax=Chitinophaga sp. Cy-1792 TaxID=2608339 RepID=UPI00141E4C45|nr:redoxin family protein [Chitinophaga sp. Cy-1792]NIG53983.1 redoxin domain-containing protein [Chitinophaga sp. Cy-1792]
MFKSAFYLSLCTVILTSFRSARDANLDLGAPIPKAETRLTDISGKEISLNAIKNSNGLLVIFVANQCPYMLRNKERLQAVCAFAQKNNVGVAMINSNEANRAEGESLAAMKAYAGQHQFSWYYLLDRNAELADAFDANHTPECFLFDKSGKLVYKGGIDDSPGNAEAVKAHLLRNAMNDMLAGKAVSIASSAALGCNIKRKL